MWWLIIILLIVLVWVARLREGFINPGQNPDQQGRMTQATLPDPSQMVETIRGLMDRVGGQSENSPILQKMQGLLDKYDNPDNLGHVLRIKDKDPGELARMYLNINN